MAYFQIGSTDISDCVSSLNVATETLLSDSSGRNANGDTVVDIINTKKTITVGFRPMSDTEMATLMTLIDSYVVSVSYLEPKTKALTTISCRVSTPQPDYYTIQTGKVQFKAFSMDFI